MSSDDCCDQQIFSVDSCIMCRRAYLSDLHMDLGQAVETPLAIDHVLRQAFHLILLVWLCDRFGIDIKL
jgi:hypothetical protein